MLGHFCYYVFPTACGTKIVTNDSVSAITCSPMGTIRSKSICKQKMAEEIFFLEKSLQKYEI